MDVEGQGDDRQTHSRDHILHNPLRPTFPDNQPLRIQFGALRDCGTRMDWTYNEYRRYVSLRQELYECTCQGSLSPGRLGVTLLRPCLPATLGPKSYEAGLNTSWGGPLPSTPTWWTVPAADKARTRKRSAATPLSGSVFWQDDGEDRGAPPIDENNDNIPRRPRSLYLALPHR